MQLELEASSNMKYEARSFKDSEEFFKDLFNNKPDVIAINSKKSPLHTQVDLLINIGLIQVECRKKHKKIYRPIVIFM